MIAVIIRAFGPDDPLGPVNQDADEIRDDACHLVAPDSVCSPRPPRPTDLPSGGAGGGWGSVLEIFVWVVFFSLVAALVFVIVRVLMTTHFGSRRRRTRRSKDDGDGTDEVVELSSVIDRTREPAEWRRDAEQHRAAGRHREAVRCRYRALVGDLARHGLIDEIPGRTSGEERTQMTAVAPDEAPAFSSAAELFDRAWFGDVTVAEQDVRRMEALEVSVLAGVGVPAP